MIIILLFNSLAMFDFVKKNSGTQASEWLLRGSFGIFLLFSGIGKFMMGIDTFVGFIVPGFEETFLPKLLVTAFAYAMPFLEFLLGLWLLTGFKRDWALIGTGKFLAILMFGLLLQGNVDTVNKVFIYIFIIAYTLSLPKYKMMKED